MLCYESFRYVSTLRKKVFLGALVKNCYLYGSNDSGSAVYKNDGFAEIKNQSESNAISKKKNAIKVLGMCLSYMKGYFQEHH